MQAPSIDRSGSTTSATAPPRRSRRRGLLILLMVVVIAMVLAIALVTAALLIGLRPVRIVGQAMEPTIPQGSYLLVQRGSYQDQAPARGEIVLFAFPGDPSLQYIGRVIGLPGEHIRIVGGGVSVNGVRLSEPYIAAPAYRDDRVVDAGSVYVLGDNRNNASDSHEWGLLPRANILGHVLAVYWPLPGKRLTTPTYPVVR